MKVKTKINEITIKDIISKYFVINLNTKSIHILLLKFLGA